MSFPILYDKRASSFTTMGLGTLTDCLKCTVTREINGAYELSMQYPVEGVHFNEIELESIVAVKVPDKDNYQLFKIYSISEPIDLTVTIDAEHVSYMTGDIPVQPFTNETPGIHHVLEAMNAGGIAIPTGVYTPFTFTDELRPDQTVFTVTEPVSMREVMGDGEGMILSKEYCKDCEWDIDNYTLTLKYSLGTNKSDSIQYVYGKNVSDLSQDQSLTNTVTAILPYVHADTDDGKPINVIGSICYGEGHENFARERIVPTNVESYFTDEEKEAWTTYGDTNIKMPTPEQVNEKASEAIKDFDFVCKPEVSVSVNPVDLTGVSGYEEVAENLKRVQLGDTITVIFDAYSISKEARVVKVVYDVINECNDNIEVGDPSPNLAATLAAIGEKTEVNRAGIIVGRDSILAYVDKTNGNMGSQLKMTEEEIKTTVASTTTSWNMIPLTGSTAIGGEAWQIHQSSYGTPEATKREAELHRGYLYFDEQTGYVWESVQLGGQWQWRRKKFARRHDFKWYDDTGERTATAYPGDESWTIKLDGYCESNITQLGYDIRQEVLNRSTGDQSIIDQTPRSIEMRVTSPSDAGGERRAGITITTVYGDGHETDASGYIILDGTVVFKSNLENSGETRINGGNIISNSITADKINTRNLVVAATETNSDANGYSMALRNGALRVYNNIGMEAYSTGNCLLPFFVNGSTGAINVGSNTRYYYIQVTNSGSSNPGSVRYLFSDKGIGTILRAYRADNDWTTLPTTATPIGIVSWYNLQIYDAQSPLDDDDSSVTIDQMRTNKITAKYWNTHNRRIMFKNCRSSMGTEGVDYDKDDMGATTRYVKWYVDGGDDSDRRWKNTITDLDNVSDKYMQLRPVSYRFNQGVDSQGKDNEIRFGLIAQEVSDLYPAGIYHMVNHQSSVDDEELSNEMKQYTPEEYYKLRYEELHALHISMIQKHEREITELKDMIKTLTKILQNEEE